jgi:hypothetical protein
MTLTPARLTASIALAGACLFTYLVVPGAWVDRTLVAMYLRAPWVTVDERDFDRRVLSASRPALVFFDTAISCRGGDSVFRMLRLQRSDVLDVFYVNAIEHPTLARRYGVADDVVFALFEKGQVTRWATAPMVLGSVAAKNNGFYSDDAFLAEMELFAKLRES